MMISVILSFLLTSWNMNTFMLDPCQIYGKIYEVERRDEADFIVFIEDSEYSADLVVYEHENALYADRPGQWHFVENKSFADGFVFFTNKKGGSDFIIAFTDNEAYAGCNR